MRLRGRDKSHEKCEESQEEMEHDGNFRRSPTSF